MKFTEYIYFNDNREPIYSSREPLEYEDQTLMVKLQFNTKEERRIILDAIFYNNIYLD